MWCRASDEQPSLVASASAVVAAALPRGRGVVAARAAAAASPRPARRRPPPPRSHGRGLGRRHLAGAPTSASAATGAPTSAYRSTGRRRPARPRRCWPGCAPTTVRYTFDAGPGRVRAWTAPATTRCAPVVGARRRDRVRPARRRVRRAVPGPLPAGAVEQCPRAILESTRADAVQPRHPADPVRRVGADDQRPTPDPAPTCCRRASRSAAAPSSSSRSTAGPAGRAACWPTGRSHLPPGRPGWASPTAAGTA